jgi:hypothetical protein
MRTEDRLKQWEEEHGFAGIFSATGRDINRKCGCGKRTKTLSSPFCQTCGTRARDLLAADAQGHAPEPTPEASRPPKAEPGRYRRCKTRGCVRIAKHQGTLCPQCWAAEDPETRACPVCKKVPRKRNSHSGACAQCLRNIHKAAVRLWTVSGGNMALACTALVQQGMESDATASTQLLEALQTDELTPEDMERVAFDF